MRYIKTTSILNTNNEVTLYHGCQCDCIFCDSRNKWHTAQSDFENIKVPENAMDLLEQELKKKRKKVIISTNSTFDPYIPLEKELGLTRKMLELLHQYGHGVHIFTKSNLILRDLDLLKRINNQAKVMVSIPLSTYDEVLCKQIEPNVSTTRERFEVLKELNEAGIETYVWITPILPFINDSLDNLRGILQYCKEAKVKGILCYGFGITLKDENRDFFYKKLDEFFPKIKKEYIKTFGNSSSYMSIFHKYLLDFLQKFCKREQILCDNEFILHRLQTLYEFEEYEQLSLFSEE